MIDLYSPFFSLFCSSMLKLAHFKIFASLFPHSTCKQNRKKEAYFRCWSLDFVIGVAIIHNYRIQWLNGIFVPYLLSWLRLLPFLFLFAAYLPPIANYTQTRAKKEHTEQYELRRFRVFCVKYNRFKYGRPVLYRLQLLMLKANWNVMQSIFFIAAVFLCFLTQKVILHRSW